MINKNPLVVPELRELLAAGDTKALQDFCESGHPATIAEMIAPLEAPEAWGVLRQADPFLRADIFGHLESDLQMTILEPLPRDEIARLMTAMPTTNAPISSKACPRIGGRRFCRPWPRPSGKISAV